MKKWGKMFAIFACLVLALAMAGCGGKSEKFTANSWVFVHKTDDGNEDFIDVLTFEKNNKSYTSVEKKTTYKVKYEGLMSGAGMVSQKYKMDIEDEKNNSTPGLTYDEKSDSLTINGFSAYTYMSKDNTVIDQDNKRVFKKATKEDIEKIKKDLEENTKKKIIKENQKISQK